MIEILSIGSGISIQDRGRMGWRRFGVPWGGAMDQRSLALANALLGNPADAPVLEIVLRGAQIRVLEPTWLALAGADFCSRLASGTAQMLAAGEVLTFDQIADGLYAYLAVPGGFHCEQWLGSASSDVRNGMGTVLEKGSQLKPRLSQPNATTQSVARRVSSETQRHIPTAKAHFTLHPGPQFETFTDDARQQLIESIWTVSPRSDRTGYRLEGAALDVPASIASEPVLPGSFQIPGNGQPIITMVDGPTVGGYAKIAVLKADDMDRLAQCKPGTQLSFAWID